MSDKNYRELGRMAAEQTTHEASGGARAGRLTNALHLLPHRGTAHDGLIPGGPAFSFLGLRHYRL